MTDTFEECWRQVRRERIVAERVTSLRDFSAEERADYALNLLESAITELEMVADAISPNSRLIGRIDACESRLIMLRTKLKLRRSTVHLCSAFGRAP